MIQGFYRHTARQGSVADHRNVPTVVFSGQVIRHGHTERRRNRGGGMRGAETVVGAFRALGEP